MNKTDSAMIKIIILAVLNIFFAAGLTQAQWVQEACPTRENLNSVFFLNPTCGWAVGDKGIILGKANGIWIQNPSPVKENLYSVAMTDINNGWAVGANGTIIRFNGSVWEKTESPTRNDLFAISFKDPSNGVITGKNGTILVLSENKWKQLNGNVIGNLYAVQYLEDDIIFGGGMELLNVPVIRMSIKPGNSSITVFDSNITVTGLAFTDPENGWIIGSPGVLLHYDGKSWQRSDINYRFPSMNHLSLYDKNNGICVGFSGTILSLKDGFWTKEESGTNMHLSGSAIAGRNYYAVGEKGVILVRNAEQDFQRPSSSGIAEKPINIYPNPCTDFVNIDLSGIGNYSEGTVFLTDLTGEVTDQKNFSFSNNNLHLTFSTLNYKSGIYMIKIKTGNEILHSRFIVK